VFCTSCSSDGSSYIAISSNTNVDPPTHSAVWQLIAQAGATGAAGAPGVNGTNGATGAAGVVQAIAIGSVSTTGSTGSATIGGTSANPTINLTFPAGGSTGFTWSGNYPNAASGTLYTAPNTTGNESSASQIGFLAVPSACTMSSLNVNAITTNVINPIEVDTTVVTVIKNDSATSMACTITNTTTNNATFSCSDSTHTFAVVQGDRISLRIAESLTDDDYDVVSYGTTLVCQ
jgi:hypothetical protein